MQNEQLTAGVGVHLVRVIHCWITEGEDRENGARGRTKKQRRKETAKQGKPETGITTCMGKEKGKGEEEQKLYQQWSVSSETTLEPNHSIADAVSLCQLSAGQYPYILVRRWAASDNPEYQQ